MLGDSLTANDELDKQPLSELNTRITATPESSSWSPGLKVPMLDLTIVLPMAGGAAVADGPFIPIEDVIGKLILTGAGNYDLVDVEISPIPLRDDVIEL